MDNQTTQANGKKKAVKKQTKKEPEEMPHLPQPEQPADKLKKISETQYKERQEQRQEEKRQEEKRKEQREEKRQEEEEFVEYAPTLPVRATPRATPAEPTNEEQNANIPDYIYKFVMETMGQLKEQLERVKKLKGYKQNINLKVPSDFKFE